MIKIKVERTHKDAVVPEFAHPTDSGFDLFNCEDKEISAGENAVKGVPVYTEEQGFDPLHVDLINKGERSPITVFEGTIDMDYRGEIGIMVRNDARHKITIPAQTKIAQGVLRQVFYCEFEEVDTVDTDTTRGEDGYGSTGTEKK